MDNYIINDGVKRILWGVKSSPNVRKVIVTLEEKKLQYDLKEILPSKVLLAKNQEIPMEFLIISPLGKIPAYQELSLNKNDSFSTSDSNVIMEYIEQTVRNNPLRPIDPKDNARVSWMIRYADEVLALITHNIVFEIIIKPLILGKEKQESVVVKMLKEEFPMVLDFLENILSENKSEWIANTDKFSLADIAIVSHLCDIKVSNLNLDDLIGKCRPNLLSYVDKIINRDSFKKSIP